MLFSYNYKKEHSIIYFGCLILLMLMLVSCGIAHKTSHNQETRAPIAAFSAMIMNRGSLPAAVQFSNRSKNATSYKWSFGDGESSKQENPKHDYSQSGTFIITLVASSDKGISDIAIKHIAIPRKNKYATIYPNKTHQLISNWLYDLKQKGKAKHFTISQAQSLFQNEKLTGIRIPIKATAQSARGIKNINTSAYKDILHAVHITKSVDPEAKIFASLKLHGPGLQTFPAWVLDSNHKIIASKYAILLSNYLSYMKNQDVKVNILGMDNEDKYNKGDITPLKFKIIADKLKADTDKGNFSMPKLIGPGNYGPDVAWLKTLYENNWGDRLNIIGTHYYPKWRPLSKLQRMRSIDSTKPMWNTEVHWQHQGDFEHAEKFLIAVFDCYEVGMSGMSTWSFKLVNPTKYKGRIERALVLSTLDSRPVYMSDSDGRAMDLSKLNTRAFKKNHDLIVWAINSTQNELPYGFKLNQKRLVEM